LLALLLLLCLLTSLFTEIIQNSAAGSILVPVVAAMAQVSVSVL
jgi:di/tricarboxylate transporter